jgi:hypothetical protein
LRSSIIGALAKPKNEFSGFFGYTPRKTPLAEFLSLFNKYFGF